jgi:hypothetical protein
VKTHELHEALLRDYRKRARADLDRWLERSHVNVQQVLREVERARDRLPAPLVHEEAPDGA